MANANMGVRSIRQQIASAVDLFVQISRLSDGTRKVTYMTECVGMEGEQVTTQDIFVFERLGLTRGRKNTRALQGYRRPAEIQREAAGNWHRVPDEPLPAVH